MKQIYCIWNKIEENRRSQVLNFFLFLVLVSKNGGFIQNGNPSERVVEVEEELDGIDIVYIGNTKNPPRFVFIIEVYENLIVVNDGR